MSPSCKPYLHYITPYHISKIWTTCWHYKNMPILLKNFTTEKKWKFSDINSDIFLISAQNINCGYSLELPQWSNSNEYPQSMFFSRNKKNNVYPCKPSFTLLKWGLRGSTLYRHVFVMMCKNCWMSGKHYGPWSNVLWDLIWVFTVYQACLPQDFK